MASIYSDPNVVSSYAQASYLEPAEKSIIKFFNQELTKMRMLDVAVGAGRTTSYFAPLAREYVGIDYSSAMIEACHQRFDTNCNNARFFVSDMRSIEWLSDNSFDFILISYNAISAINHEERLKVFQELKRICSNGGYIYFSAHNLQSLGKLFSFSALMKHFSIFHPKESYWKIKAWLKRKIFYNSLSAYKNAMQSEYAIINDGAENFRLKMYYVRPIEQINQLSSFFQSIKVFSRNGDEVSDQETMLKLDDEWLFYLGVNQKNINESL